MTEEEIKESLQRKIYKVEFDRKQGKKEIHYYGYAEGKDTKEAKKLFEEKCHTEWHKFHFRIKKFDKVMDFEPFNFKEMARVKGVAR